jgi:micrococcal nuclease
LETIVIIALIAGYIFVSFHKKWNRRKKNRPKRRASQERSSEWHRPFDAKSAKLLPIRAVLHGFARVIDGDTIVIEKTQIRLFGIDAPEIDHPFGRNAKWALVSLCKGQKIRAAIIEQDVHGRTVARCYLQDGRDLSAEMVKLGLAIDWPKFSGGIYRSLEVSGVRKRLWLADARQKGRLYVWEQFESKKNTR